MSQQHTMIIEEASIELVPRKLHSHKSCKLVFERFGIPPSRQILDRNYHASVMTNLQDSEKRGRPDVVHFAALDVTSTPIFVKDKIKLVIHSRDGLVISLQEGTRLPRTLQRFCGVISKILASNYGKQEESLFEISGPKNFRDLIRSLETERVISFSRLGKKESLRSLTLEGVARKQPTAWVVGGFPYGTFKKEVVQSSDNIVAISGLPLAAHTVVARICYELEVALGIL